LPLWAVSLGAAFAAPWLARHLAGAVERRARRRTNDLVATARARASLAPVRETPASAQGASVARDVG